MNKIIICDNKYCQFITEDNKLFNRIRYFLSFKMSGVEYTEAYKNGWNGITFLINKNGVFASGLLQKVKTYLEENNILYTIENKKKEIITNKEIDISSKLKELNIVPRDYQNEIVEVACANNKGIIRACTGSGKSLATALITAKLNKPTIIYVIGLDLLKQFHDLYSSIFDEPIGYVGNGTCNIKRINIASIWTIGTALKIDKDIIDLEDQEEQEIFDESKSDQIIKMLESSKVHIFDESHVVTTNTIKQIYKKIDPEYIYGFSGTPFRDDNTDLLINGILGEQIINISATQLINKGVLPQPIIKFVPVPPMRIGSQQYQTVYKEYIVNNDARNNLIVKYTKELLDKKYVPLVLFKYIKHGEILLSLMQDVGIKCEMLYGNDTLDKRTEIKDKLTNKKIDVILASTIFDMGISLDIISGLILCGSGKSSIRSLQRIGRSLRAYPGKKYTAVVDFYDQVKFLKKHSMSRYETYLSEEGFKVIKCKDMK